MTGGTTGTLVADGSGGVSVVLPVAGSAPATPAASAPAPVPATRGPATPVPAAGVPGRLPFTGAPAVAALLVLALALVLAGLLLRAGGRRRLHRTAARGPAPVTAPTSRRPAAGLSTRSSR